MPEELKPQRKKGKIWSIVEASIAITADGFVPHATRKDELSGAELDTVKTPAFDLATVASSLEGQGEHPRCLIHDGPQVDMAPVICGRFFIYVAEMETVFPSPDESNFQFLVTTTPPPNSMHLASDRSWTLGSIPGRRTSEF